MTKIGTRMDRWKKGPNLSRKVGSVSLGSAPSNIERRGGVFREKERNLPNGRAPKRQMQGRKKGIVTAETVSRKEDLPNGLASPGRGGSSLAVWPCGREGRKQKISLKA